MSTQNILLKSSYVIICSHINIDKYKLEIYTNGNIKIMNVTCNTEYFYINDYIKIIPTIVNMYISLFETICDKNQLDNFILGIQMVKKNLKTYFDRIKSKRVIHFEQEFNKKKIKIENDNCEIMNKSINIDSKNINYEKLLSNYTKIKSENKSLIDKMKTLKTIL